MPKRNDKRDTAKAEYVKRRRSGEKINLKDFANEQGVTYGTVRNWKRIDQWEDAIERKRGGQPGNKNSRGRRMQRAIPAAVRRTATPTPRKTAHIARFTLNV
ncbi:phage terminase small subunit-related protein [Faecalibacterium taiwanense]|uniref:phage terminase small subunit-related protein n=1 Tax=Faecalibacterium taiwanense TaxID=3030638 RepID=UPI0031FF471D